MARQTLSLDTLDQFDFGKASAAFSMALEKAVRDCLDRPGEKKAREVSLVAKLTPVLLQDGDVVDCEIGFTIGCGVPKWQTAARPVGATTGGQLFFQELAPDNPDQMTVDDFAEEGGEAAE